MYRGTGDLPPGPVLAFVRNLGFVKPTEARRISFEESLRFEKIHEQTYRDFGFELVAVKPASLEERVRIIKAAIC